MSQNKTRDIHVPWINHVDYLLKLLIWLSVVLYLVELQTGSADSRSGHAVFLWVERGIALILTLDYSVRLTYSGPRYALSPLGLIDFISVFPFWAGFFVPDNWLGVVRALRVLRLLKYFRYSRSMQLVALAFYRAKFQLRSLAFTMLVVILFGTVMLFESEKNIAGGKFNTLFDSFVKVSLTTMNCGAIEPQTTAGKLLSLLVFLPAMAIFAGLIGVLSNAFATVLEEFADPNSDPLVLFKKAKEKLEEVSKIEKEYRTEKKNSNNSSTE